MGRKLKEMEQALSEREAQIAELSRNVQRQNDTINEYRAKETAIAGALTRAQAAAERIIAEANEQKEQTIGEANAKKAELIREGEEVLNDAKRRAEMIESDAKAKAKGITDEADAYMREYRTKVDRMQRVFKRVAEDAARQAEEYRAFADSVNVDGEVEAGIAREGATPEEYANPRELMQSIYQIQGRDIPKNAEDKRTSYEKWRDEHEHEDHSEHPTERISSFRPEAQPLGHSQREDKSREADANEEGSGAEASAIVESASDTLPDGDVSAVEAAVKPSEDTMEAQEEADAPEEAEEASLEEDEAEETDAADADAGDADAADADAADADAGVPVRAFGMGRIAALDNTLSEAQEDDEDEKADGGEEKLWTVEEIVERTSASANNEIDDELNSIIDDVLKGS